jgi:predicted ABC-type ATPase
MLLNISINSDFINPFLTDNGASFFTMELLDKWMIFDNTEYEPILVAKKKCRRKFLFKQIFR